MLVLSDNDTVGLAHRTGHRGGSVGRVGEHLPSDYWMKLHVGCGPHVVPGWENLDKSPSVFLSRVPALRSVLRRLRVLTPQQAQGFPPGVVHADITRRLPYPNGSVDYIYSSHVIEHLARWQALRFVQECVRVLRPGGIVRTATPDLAVRAIRYLELRELGDSRSADQPTAADVFMQGLETFREPETNLVQRLIYRLVSGTPHQWLYDADSLGRVLTEGGLVSPTERGYREGELPDLDTIETREDSIFVEARKG
jgi:predicted SAM-dependent methyltransferase